jgi:adenylate cyclase
LLGAENALIAELIHKGYRLSAPVSDFEVPLIGDNGGHYLNVNIVPLRSHDNESRGQVLVFEDITSEHRMKSTLSRYMAKDIVDRLLGDPHQQALGGTKGTATIMFSDIRDYTEISESLSAEETVAFLNEYFSLMAGVVSENGGVLDKYIGDAIMSVFGVPYSRDDDPQRAIRAALAMRNRLGLFNARRRSEGKPPIRAGIGICTGDVICGNIGSERRMDFTVIGDSVNVASRIEKLNKVYQTDILISRSTCERLGETFAARLVDVVRIRGRQRAIEIYEVLGEGNVSPTTSEGYFEKGRAHYQKGRFEQAADLFRRGRSGDSLCDVYYQRCVSLQAHPPENWDGIWDFTS